MPQTKKSQKAAAARACMERYQKKAILSDPTLEQSNTDNIHNPAIECTGWTGGVKHVLSDTETDFNEEDWKNTDGEGSESNKEDNADLEELKGEDLLDGLWNKWELLQQELENLANPTPYEHILKKTKAKEWKNAKAQRGFEYNGLSDRWKWEVAQQLQEKEEHDKVTCKR
jgi:hypothetical protein